MKAAHEGLLRGLNLFPNQALYQAEPQPEIHLFPDAQADAPLTSRILSHMARNSALDQLLAQIILSPTVAEKSADGILLEK